MHQVGVLHRDIKPSNVLLEGRSPVLIDFGLARLAEDPRLTHDRLAARHARLPRARDPLRRRRDHRLRRALVGRDRGVRRDRPAAVRHRAGDGDHGPGPARRARPVRRARRRCCRWCGRASPPTPRDRPETAAVPARRLRGAGARRPHDARRARRAADRAARRSPTTPLTTGPSRRPRTRPLTGPSALQPARAPYMQPPAPQQPARDGRPRLVPPDAWRPAARRAAEGAARRRCCSGCSPPRRSGSRGRRTSCLLRRRLVALAVRTVSWTTESARRAPAPARPPALVRRAADRGVVAVVPRRGDRRHARCCCSGRRRRVRGRLRLPAVPGAAGARPAADGRRVRRVAVVGAGRPGGCGCRPGGWCSRPPATPGWAGSASPWSPPRRCCCGYAAGDRGVLGPAAGPPGARDAPGTLVRWL